MKTAISIPDEIFEAAEELTKRLGVSRSELFSKAVSSFVKSHRNEGVTDQLNKIYGEEESFLDPVLNRLQHQSLPEEW
jgi:metal-responsive CopG/Arc/MetJ family transcriptional regulator